MNPRLTRIERLLETGMCRRESEPFVEPMRIGARGVRRELHQRRICRPRPILGICHQGRADPLPAQVRAHPHGFDLGPDGVEGETR